MPGCSGLERVGADDNFFELGGDSILTIQVVARAGQAGIRITPKQLFQAPTVAGVGAARRGRATAGERGRPSKGSSRVTSP